MFCLEGDSTATLTQPQPLGHILTPHEPTPGPHEPTPGPHTLTQPLRLGHIDLSAKREREEG